MAGNWTMKMATKRAAQALAGKRRTVLAGFVAAALSLAAALVVWSPSDSFAATSAIETAKSRCIVGERNDGYLGVIDERRASDSVRREVASVNQRRKAAYARLAEKNGVSIRDTGVVAAEKLIARARSGHCVQNAAGTWIKKP